MFKMIRTFIFVKTFENINQTTDGAQTSQSSVEKTESSQSNANTKEDYGL